MVLDKRALVCQTASEIMHGTDMPNDAMINSDDRVLRVLLGEDAALYINGDVMA